MIYFSEYLPFIRFCFAFALHVYSFPSVQCLLAHSTIISLPPIYLEAVHTIWLLHNIERIKCRTEADEFQM